MKKTFTLFILLYVFCSCRERSKPNVQTIAKKPNIILILTDDQGWGDLGVNGNTNLNTPHIDALAENGAIFENFYVQPVCSPTRAELLTGRYASRSGVYGTPGENV